MELSAHRGSTKVSPAPFPRGPPVPSSPTQPDTSLTLYASALHTQPKSTIGHSPIPLYFPACIDCEGTDCSLSFSKDILVWSASCTHHKHTVQRVWKTHTPESKTWPRTQHGHHLESSFQALPIPGLHPRGGRCGGEFCQFCLFSNLRHQKAQEPSLGAAGFLTERLAVRPSAVRQQLVPFCF